MLTKNRCFNCYPWNTNIDFLSTRAKPIAVIGVAGVAGVAGVVFCWQKINVAQKTEDSNNKDYTSTRHFSAWLLQTFLLVHIYMFLVLYSKNKFFAALIFCQRSKNIRQINGLSGKGAILPPLTKNQCYFFAPISRESIIF